MRLPRRRLRSARVYLNGKRVRTLRGEALRSPVRLRRFPGGKLLIRVVARTSDGGKVVTKRRFSVCAARSK